MLYAWTAPAAGVVPPAQNAPAPITISDVNQNKQGVLGLGGLAVFGKSLFSETSGYKLPLKTSSNNSMLLGVNGSIGAKEYCDEKGQNCVSTLSGGVVGAGASVSGGQKIICGGWDVKYGSTEALNSWGCAAPASNPVCPSGYDIIKSSKVTINLAEHTNLCVLQNSSGGSGVQMIPGWPNKILCDAGSQKSILYIDGVSGEGYPENRVRYSSFQDTGPHTSLHFNYSNGNYISLVGRTEAFGKAIDVCIAKGNIKNQKGFN